MTDKPKVELTWGDVHERAKKVATELLRVRVDDLKAFPVPNGGVPAALAIQNAYTELGQGLSLHIVDSPVNANVILDDVIDSGATRGRFNKAFFALANKLGSDKELGWITFPWERAIREDGPQDSVRRMLQYIGEDPKREGLLDTPKRVVKAWDELFEGYKVDPEKLLTVFESDGYDEMVVLKGIEFVSFCEHHVLPFYGQASIAYIPNGKVIGISKLARLLEVYSRRLQIQERLCKQITDALDKHLQPLGSACVLEASHSCMTCRGVKKQNSRMITSSLTGTFKTDAAARSEFMQFVK